MGEAALCEHGAGLADNAAFGIGHLEAAQTLAAVERPWVSGAVQLPEGGVILNPVQWAVCPTALHVLHHFVPCVSDLLSFGTILSIILQHLLLHNITVTHQIVSVGGGGDAGGALEYEDDEHYDQICQHE